MAQFIGTTDIEVTDVTERAELCSPGILFAAIPGTRRNGQEFAGDAVLRGANALLVDRPMDEVAIPQCIVPDVRRAFALVCDALQGHPSQKLRLVGVTGTNGK